MILKNSASFLLSLSLLILAGNRLYAAACCGSNSYLPAIISGDDQTQITLSFGMGQVVANASPSGQVTQRPSGARENTLSSKFDAATLLSDRWQVGLSVPVRQRSRESFQGRGLGDVSVSLSYEALPEWSYSVWRPRGFVFLNTRLPTGRSRFESSAAHAIDAFGKGFWGTSGGILLVKSWGNWDASFVGEIGRSFNITYGASRYYPAWNASATLGAGYSPAGGALRFGFSISPAFESGIAERGPGGDFDYPSETTWLNALQVSYLASSTLSLGLNYTDNTWFSLNRNVALSRGVNLVIQKRWAR